MDAHNLEIRTWMKNWEGKSLVHTHIPREIQPPEINITGKATHKSSLHWQTNRDAAVLLRIDQEAVKSRMEGYLGDCLLNKVRTNTSLSHMLSPTPPTPPTLMQKGFQAVSKHIEKAPRPSPIRVSRDLPYFSPVFEIPVQELCRVYNVEQRVTAWPELRLPTDAWVHAGVLNRFSGVSLCDPMDYSPPGSSVHGILQARILEWVAMPSSRGSSQPRDGTLVS